MANTYVVTSMATVGSIVIVNGTVNNVVVQVYYPSSKTFANVLAFEAYIQPLMLAAAATPLLGYTGTWTG